MKIAIFGVGFIGKATGRMLSALGHHVVGCDNWMIGGNSNDAGFPCEFVDVCHAPCIKDFLLRHTPDRILWLPAKQGYGPDYSVFSQVQVSGTYALFEALDTLPRQYGASRRIVLASSQAVYSPFVGVEEDGGTDPPSVYGLSKLQQERAFFWFCEHANIECYAMRYSIVLGPGQALKSTESGLLRNWFHLWKAGKAPQVYGDGSQLRDFVHIRDVARVNVSAVLKSSHGAVCEAYNIGGKHASISTMASTFQKLTNCLEPVKTGSSVRPGGEYSMTSKSNKAWRTFDWKPELDPAQCLKDFLDNERQKDQTEAD